MRAALQLAPSPTQPPVAPDDIAFIEQWIDDGCPAEDAARQVPGAERCANWCSTCAALRTQTPGVYSAGVRTPS